MYLSFVLDLTAGPIRETVCFEPDRVRRKLGGFQWKVVRDVAGRVTVRGFHDGKEQLVGFARWIDGKLVRHQGIGTIPTEYQWSLVETAIRAESARTPPHRDRADDPSWPVEVTLEEIARLDVRDADQPPLVDAQLLARHQKRQRDRRVIASAVAVLALIAIGVIVVTTRRDTSLPIAQPAPAPPPPQPLPLPLPNATDAPVSPPVLRWTDVEGSETTLGHAMRDPEAERGRRLCVQGTVQRIERKDIEGQRAFDGELMTDDGDLVSFAVTGAVGDVVKRSAARLCGRADGTQAGAVHIRGMLDLPENRAPLVEQER